VSHDLASLVNQKQPKDEVEHSTLAGQIAVELLQGDLDKTLERPEVKAMLEQILKENSEMDVGGEAQQPMQLSADEQTLRLLVGVCCTFVFTQWNWTGPQPTEFVGSFLKQVRQSLLACLCLDKLVLLSSDVFVLLYQFLISNFRLLTRN
jgi:hypothetical protein